MDEPQVRDEAGNRRQDRAQPHGLRHVSVSRAGPLRRVCTFKTNAMCSCSNCPAAQNKHKIYKPAWTNSRLNMPSHSLLKEESRQ